MFMSKTYTSFSPHNKHIFSNSLLFIICNLVIIFFLSAFFGGFWTDEVKVFFEIHTYLYSPLSIRGK